MRMSFPYWIRFQGQTLGLVWQTDDEANDEGDPDGVLVRDGQIVSARTHEDFSNLARQHNLTLEAGNGDPQNLDGIEDLLRLPASDDICTQLLNAWNLLGDVARSVDASLDWLRGGWAMDFYLGRLTREHLDVDWYVWDGDMAVIAKALVARGWTDVGQHPAEQQRDLVKGPVEFGIAPLARAGDGRVVVGGGPWRNAALPKDILANALNCQLGGIQCAVISPAAQIEIKQMMSTWVPGLPRRSKDAADIDLLAEAVDVARLDRDDAARGTCQ